MERSGSQKFLLVISIIDIVVGALALIGAFMLFFLGVGTSAVQATDPAALSSAGITAQDAAAAATGFSALGLLSLVSGAIALLEGILGVRAANDNQKIMPVWVLALIGLIFSVIGLVMGIVDGSFGSQATTLIATLAGSLLMFWVANNIKKQAGR